MYDLLSHESYIKLNKNISEGYKKNFQKDISETIVQL